MHEIVGKRSVQNRTTSHTGTSLSYNQPTKKTTVTEQWADESGTTGTLPAHFLWAPNFDYLPTHWDL